jgi:hypothetical protein
MLRVVINCTMEQKLATLTGSEGAVKGFIKHVKTGGLENAWEFDSIDGTLHLTIAQDDNGHWQKIAGTEPYLFGWVDEMAEQINQIH